VPKKILASKYPVTLFRDCCAGGIDNWCMNIGRIDRQIFVIFSTRVARWREALPRAYYWSGFARATCTSLGEAQ